MSNRQSQSGGWSQTRAAGLKGSFEIEAEPQQCSRLGDNQLECIPACGCFLSVGLKGL